MMTTKERSRIKICGITRSEDAQLAAELGAWAVGFVFYTKSARWIQPSVAKAIVNRLPQGVRKVGVFVDANLAEITQAVEAGQIDTIQLHGAESPAFCVRVKESLPRHYLIKAMRVGGELDLEFLAKFDNCDALLLDAFVPGDSMGGNGKCFDWSVAGGLGQSIRERLIIAGGLNSQNVKSALDYFHPFALDVSSAVEQRPGVKDEASLRQLFTAVGGRAQ